MLNEHHNAPFCMQAKANIFAAILAAATKRVKIVMLGNPLPLAENPIRLAEELAMIDMISKGRLVSGLRARRRPGAAGDRRQPRLQPRALRGGARPHREDLDACPVPSAGKARTTSTASSIRGPCRCRSPIRAFGSRASSARRRSSGRRKQRYPYIALNTSIEQTKSIWKLYDDTAAAVGYKIRSGEPRLSRAHPRGRDRGEGHPERQAVHVDAGRVHRASRIRSGPIRQAISRRAGGAISSSSRSAGPKIRVATRRSKSSAPTA